ncbi:MAG: hypothetical protein QXS63_05050 [Zestosphaera sp.]
MSQTSIIDKLLDEEDERLELLLRDIDKGLDPALLFLETFVRHMEIAASHIDCPYCAKHMRLEAGKIAKIVERIRREGNKVHNHGIGEMFHEIVIATKILIYTILGGLKRAGII